MFSLHRYMYLFTISFPSKFKISSLCPASVTVQPGLCRAWSETPKTDFLCRHEKSRGLGTPAPSGYACPDPLPSNFKYNVFANYHVLKHQLTNLISFYIPKVVKSVTKIVEIGSQIKIQCPKIIWTWAFSVVKIVPREVTIFLGKINF